MEKNPPIPTFDLWLCEVMKRNKIKASDLARLLHCHHNVVRSWQRGRNLPNGYYIAKIIVAITKETEEPFTELCESCFDALINHHNPK
jgi:hypothetical protein